MSRFGLLLGGMSAAAAGAVFYHVVLSGDTPHPNDRFSGGSYSGHANDQLIQLSPTPYISPPRFSGGSYDGYTFLSIRVNEQTPIPAPARFSGGASDGYHVIILGVIDEPAPLPPVRFSGGSFDGYSSLVQLHYANGSQLGARRFWGGSLDGHAYAALETVGTDNVYSHRFRGGPFDGYAVIQRFVLGEDIGQISPRYFGGHGDGYDTASFQIAAVIIMLDSDSDGIPDWWEELYLGGPTNAVAHALADESGMTNLEKYIAGLTPGDPASVLIFTDIALAEFHADDSTVTLSWNTVLGRVYRIYVSDDLRSPWSTEPVYEYFGNGQQAIFTHPAGDQAPRLFRLTVELILQ